MIEKNIRLQPHHSRDLLVGRRSDGRRPKYQPPGHRDAPSPSRGGPPGGGGGHHSPPSRPAPAPSKPAPSHDRGGQQHAAQAAAAQAAAAANRAAEQKAAAEREMRATIAQAESNQREAERSNQLAEARRLMTQPTTVDVPIKGPELIPGTTGPVTLDPYRQNIISPGRVDIKDRYQTGDYDDLVQEPIDVGFQEALRKQEIATDLRQKQQDPDYGQFFRPQPVVEKPRTGIMGTVKEKATQIAKNLAQQKTMQALGLAKYNPYVGVGSWLLDKFAPGAKAKLTSKFKYTGPKTDTQEEATKELVSRDTRDGDGIQQAVTGGEDVVTENIKKFTGQHLTTDPRDEYRRRRNMVQGILDQGSYQGKELTEQQRNNLLNYIEQISKFLVDPMEVAYGGRIDKALGGRSRDIG